MAATRQATNSGSNIVKNASFPVSCLASASLGRRRHHCVSVQSDQLEDGLGSWQFRVRLLPRTSILDTLQAVDQPFSVAKGQSRCPTRPKRPRRRAAAPRRLPPSRAETSHLAARSSKIAGLFSVALELIADLDVHRSLSLSC